MIGVPIGPQLRWLAVAAPSYFRKHAKPETPHELAGHQCVNQRLPTLGGFYPWEFEKDGHELKVRVEGQLALNRIDLVREAALAGLGIAFLPEDYVQPQIAKGRLIPVLQDWSPPWPGYYLYYPSRRQQSRAFALLVDALRFRGS